MALTSTRTGAPTSGCRVAPPCSKGSTSARPWSSCAGTICDELKVVDPPVQRQIVLEMDTLTPETYRKDYLATGRPVVLRNFLDEEARYLGTRDRFRTDGISWTHGIETVRGERDEGQGMRGVSSCLRVPRGTCGAQERTIETRGDPVVQGADEDSWARAVGLEATLSGGGRCGAALHCHSAALNALFVGQKDWFLIPPHRTTLSGMAAEKFLVVALHYILKCDVVRQRRVHHSAQ